MPKTPSALPAPVTLPGRHPPPGDLHSAAVRRLLLATALLALILPAVASARRTVPQGWMGMVVNRDRLGTPAHADTEWSRMVSTGVESVRSPFVWARAQPDDPAGGSSLPRDRFGVPTDFSDSDDVVAATARRGLPVLPVVIQAPTWAAADPGDNLPHPKDARDYAHYVTDLVERYGPNGTFWTEHPELPRRPIRAWQVWNEPNIPYFWHGPWLKGYRALLVAAHNAIKAADPGAKVVLGAFSNAAHAVAWRSLGELYKTRVRGLFDQVAVHPYTLLPKNVLRSSRYVRDVMRRYGDGRKPLLITELSWPSTNDNRGHNRTDHNYGFNVTERQQAQKITEVYRLLAKARRSLGITAVYWYTWVSVDRGRTDPFDYAGLRTVGSPSSDSRAKPAFYAWRRAVLSLEGCRRGAKSSVTRCG